MTIVLSTPPFSQFYDDNGNPLNGGLVYTYLAGTLTPQATYTDQGGLTQNANPVVLDSAGRASIWLDNSASYKIIVKTSTGTTLSNGTQDNIAPFSSASGLSIIGNIASNSIVGNNTGSPATPAALTVAQALGLLGVISLPGGRITLSSTAPVLTADVTAQATIYYLPYKGQLVPVWDGSKFVNQDIGSSGVSLVLNSTNHPTTKAFDVYASMQSGVLTLSAMYWGSNTSRSSTLGGFGGTADATITLKNGVWVNTTAIATGQSYNNITAVVIPQFQGTLVGSFYTTAGGQTGVNIKPAALSGGSNNVVGIFNAYNRVKVTSQCQDSSSWTYGTATWRALHGTNNNRITYIDGLQQICPEAGLTNYVTSGSLNYGIGVALNSTGATPIMSHQANTGSAIGATQECWAPQLGVNFLQAMETAAGGTSQTLNATTTSAVLIANLEY